ncbi:MAG: hypothetical protein F4Y02_12605 [Chloroflexi bacterium]|nr:hypothetical protein [Chloroflexota bacterium]
MSAELVGILSVGATLVVGGLATAGAVVGLILRLDSRSTDRMDAMEERLGARMDHQSARMDRLRADLAAMEGRLSARMDRMDARMDRIDARMDRIDARMETMESRQYELVQTVIRMDATQQAMLETLARIEERTGSAGDPPGQPALFETGSSAGDDPRQSAPTPA